MKSKGIKNYISVSFNRSAKIIFMGFMALNLVACGDDGGGFKANSSGYGSHYANSREACYDQKYNVGIVGNTYCPYQGGYANGRYEAFAQIEVGAAIYLDFGFQYNDACPAGSVPVYENQYGQLRLKRCDRIGNDFVDNFFYAHHNTSSCNGGWAGDKNCIPGW